MSPILMPCGLDERLQAPLRAGRPQTARRRPGSARNLREQFLRLRRGDPLGKVLLVVGQLRRRARRRNRHRPECRRPIFSRSPAASMIRVSLRADFARRRVGNRAPACCRNGSILATFCFGGSALHVAVLKRPQLLGVEAGRRLGDPLEREVLDHLLAGEILGLVVERPAEQHQVVDDRVGQVADFAIEIDDHGIERLGGRRCGRCAAAISAP